MLLATFVELPVARAFPAFASRAPQGSTWGSGSYGDGCLLCHNDEEGTGCVAAGGALPCLNPFGADFDAATGGRTTRTWDAWLRDRDSDGDGRTNGQELIYFGATYPDASSPVGDPALATQPGLSTSVHTDECSLQASASWGYAAAPRNYTNCAMGTLCSDGSSASSVPPGTRYFGFTCGCPAGYAGNGRRDVAGDGVPDAAANGCTLIDPCLAAGTCSDTNECASIGACGPHATGCVNLLGSYQCACAPGYAAPVAGGTCTDVDECVLDNPCAPGTCSNADGGYSCTSCPVGYELAAGNCVDADECASAACGEGLCLEDDPGHYRCVHCPSGYAAPPLDGPCVDVDECAITSPCDAHATCMNAPGSFACTCDAGFEGTGVTCNDVDECADGTGVCAANEVCVNQVGTYGCDCATGFARPTPAAGCDPVCGDGAIVAGEGCDDGAANSNVMPNACRSDCMPARCGDAVVDDGESCDPGGGAALEISSCTTACAPDGGTGDAGAGPMPDAGGDADAGAGPMPDAASDADAGAGSMLDAATDAGAGSMPDAGRPAGSGGGGAGCGCRVAEHARGAGFGWWIAVLLLVSLGQRSLGQRRRRRARAE